jgi:hypothetical protein
MEYTWKLTKLKKVSSSVLEGAVVQTYWELTGTDQDGNTGIFSGATPFELDTIDPDNFTPYEQLTEQQVLGWIQAVVVGSYKEHVEDQIAKQIQEKKLAIVEEDQKSFPWSENEEETTLEPEDE